MVSINTQAGESWNQFVDRDAISAWAAHSGLVVESFFDGDKGHIHPRRNSVGERLMHEIVG
jgi:hypothetical protein